MKWMKRNQIYIIHFHYFRIILKQSSINEIWCLRYFLKILITDCKPFIVELLTPTILKKHDLSSFKERRKLKYYIIKLEFTEKFLYVLICEW